MRKFLEIFLSHKIEIGLSLLWSLLFIVGLINFTGSKLIYTIFSITSLLMLLSGIFRQESYGYLFLVVFLWLGSWFKLNASLLLSGHFLAEEAIGNFNGSAVAWDKVLWVVICTNIGAIAGRFFYDLFHSKCPSKSAHAIAPAWYPAIRMWLWLGIITAAVVVAVVNTLLGIHQIGLAPNKILPWPLNALIAWLLNVGFAVAIAVLIHWDLKSGIKIKLSLYAILGEAFLGATSVMSRAVFLFHSIPQILALNRTIGIFQKYSRMHILLFATTLGSLFFISIVTTSLFRDYKYADSKAVRMPAPNIVPNSQGIVSIKSAAPDPTDSKEQISSLRFQLLRQLVVNRWIGLEGVMAVSSFPDKSFFLLWEILTEKREIGKVSAYQKVSNSGYQVTDIHYQFAAIPGISGFLYFSGSLWLVFFGTGAFAVFAILTERMVFLLNGNPLLCSFYGVLIANTIAQFGLTPRQDIPQFLMLYAAVLVIWAVQTRSFSSMIEKLGTYRGHA